MLATVSVGSAATGTIAADYSEPLGAINPAVTQAQKKLALQIECLLLGRRRDARREPSYALTFHDNVEVLDSGFSAFMARTLAFS